MTISRRVRTTRKVGLHDEPSATPGRMIVLFGDSHSYAVQRAIEKRLGKGRSTIVVAHRLSKVKNGRAVGDMSFEDFLAKVRTLGPNDIVLSMIGGNQHAVFSLIQHPRPFDFLEPHGKHLEDEAEVIPYRMLEGFFEEAIRNGDGESLAALRRATSARVIHIIPPPPKRDNDFLKQYH